MSRRLTIALLAGAVAATTCEVVTFYVNGWPEPPDQAIYLISSVVVLVTYLTVGLVAWRRYPHERVGLLFTVVGYAWFLPSLTNIYAPLTFTIGLLTASLYQASLVHLALAWPYGRLRSRFDRIVVIGEYVWVLGNTGAALLFWDTRNGSCGPSCPANLLLVHASGQLYTAIGSVATPIGIAIALVVVARIVEHWMDASGYARQAMTRLVWVAIPIAAWIVVLQLPNYVGLSNDVVNGFGPLVLILAPGAYAIGMYRARSARGAVGTALVALEPGPAPGRLRDALAKALGDPLLQLAFRQPATGRYLDTEGEAVDPARLPIGQVATTLDGGDALLIHDEQLDHEPELVRVASAAASLAIEHARLQAEIEAQLEQVRASRARIVEAGDAERRRLERDLHDGAQQRLVTLSLALAMARDRADGADPELESLIESASTEAREALVELRELARGIHPAVLTETGLAGAVQALVERSPVTTTISEVPRTRFPSGIEATAYFVVSEALANVAKHSRAASAEVAIRHLPGRLVVQVSDDGTGGARLDAGSGLRGLADRVASVGGVLRVESPPGSGTRLEADLPCA